MKFFIGVVLALATSCTSVQTSVRGDLLISPLDTAAPPTTYAIEVVESHSTGGLLVACILTGLFYGGACWGYLATPFEADERLAVEHAREQAQRIGRCADVVGTTLERKGWNERGPIQVIVHDKRGRLLDEAEVAQLCTAPATPAAATPAAAPPSAPSSAAPAS